MLLWWHAKLMALVMLLTWKLWFTCGLSVILCFGGMLFGCCWFRSKGCWCDGGYDLIVGVDEWMIWNSWWLKFNHNRRVLSVLQLKSCCNTRCICKRNQCFHWYLISSKMCILTMSSIANIDSCATSITNDTVQYKFTIAQTMQKQIH